MTAPSSQPSSSSRPVAHARDQGARSRRGSRRARAARPSPRGRCRAAPVRMMSGGPADEGRPGEPRDRGRPRAAAAGGSGTKWSSGSSSGSASGPTARTRCDGSGATTARGRSSTGSGTSSSGVGSSGGASSSTDQRGTGSSTALVEAGHDVGEERVDVGRVERRSRRRSASAAAASASASTRRAASAWKSARRAGSARPTTLRASRTWSSSTCTRSVGRGRRAAPRGRARRSPTTGSATRGRPRRRAAGRARGRRPAGRRRPARRSGLARGSPLSRPVGRSWAPVSRAGRRGRDPCTNSTTSRRRSARRRCRAWPRGSCPRATTSVTSVRARFARIQAALLGSTTWSSRECSRSTGAVIRRCRRGSAPRPAAASRRTAAASSRSRPRPGPGLLDVVADAGERLDHVPHQGQQVAVLALGVHRRVDQHEAGDLVGPRFSASRSVSDPPIDRPITKTWSHRSRSEVNARSTSAYQSSQRVTDMSCQRGAVAGQARQLDGEPGVDQVLGPGPHRLRRPGEAVDDQHAGAGSRRARRVRRREAVARVAPVGSGAVRDGLGRRSAGRAGRSSRVTLPPRYVARRAGAPYCRHRGPDRSDAGRTGRGSDREARRRRRRCSTGCASTSSSDPGSVCCSVPRSRASRTCPADGAAILAGNHLSFSDSIFLPLVCKRKIDVPRQVATTSTPRASRAG